MNVSWPAELEVLRLLPRCWSQLAPLVCGYFYRPCSIRAGSKNTRRGIETAAVHLHQRFRRTVCESARRACAFAIDRHFWPSFIDCDDETVFADGQKCKKRANLVSVSEGECLWPLVHTRFTSRGQPGRGGGASAVVLVDDCALPCRNPFFWPPHLLAVRRTIGFTSAFLFVCCILTFMWLLVRSAVYWEHLTVFSVGNALLCLSVYWLIWSLTLVDYVYEAAMCLPDGAKRDGAPEMLTEWCNVQFGLVYLSAMGGANFLCVFGMLRLSPAAVRASRWVATGGAVLSVRLCLCLAAFLWPLLGLSVCIAVRVKVDTDGVSGVCFVGSRRFQDASFFYGPLVISFLMWFIVLITLHYRCYKNWKEKSSSRGGDDSESVEKDGSEIAADEDKEKDQRSLLNGQIEEEHEMALSSSHKIPSVLTSSYSTHHEPLSMSLSVAFLVVLAATMMGAVVLHRSLGTSADNEMKAIMTSIDCLLNQTIRGLELDWLGVQRWPPSCRTHWPMDVQTPTRLRLLVLSPALPSVFLLVALVAGCFPSCRCCTVRGVRRLRTKTSKDLRIATDSNELTKSNAPIVKENVQDLEAVRLIEQSVQNSSSQEDMESSRSTDLAGNTRTKTTMAEDGRMAVMSERKCLSDVENGQWPSRTLAPSPLEHVHSDSEAQKKCHGRRVDLMRRLNEHKKWKSQLSSPSCSEQDISTGVLQPRPDSQTGTLTNSDATLPPELATSPVEVPFPDLNKYPILDPAQKDVYFGFLMGYQQHTIDTLMQQNAGLIHQLSSLGRPVDHPAPLPDPLAACSAVPPYFVQSPGSTIGSLDRSFASGDTTIVGQKSEQDEEEEEEEGSLSPATSEADSDATMDSSNVDPDEVEFVERQIRLMESKRLQPLGAEQADEDDQQQACSANKAERQEEMQGDKESEVRTG